MTRDIEACPYPAEGGGCEGGNRDPEQEAKNMKAAEANLLIGRHIAFDMAVGTGQKSGQNDTDHGGDQEVFRPPCKEHKPLFDLLEVDIFLVHD
ncbi:MAG: hypothetical protein ABF812_14845, partial [Gluconobacter cerinus]